MRVEFDERAEKELFPPCFRAHPLTKQKALLSLVPLLINRAKRNGDCQNTYALVAGKRIELCLLERRDPQGELYMLVTVKEGVLR